ncbi:MAG: CpaF family protein [Candidatus Micrarchaeota archaeon]
MAYMDDLIKEAKAKRTQKTASDEEETKKIEAGPVQLKPDESGEYLITGPKTLIKQYGDARIYKVEGEPLIVYATSVVKPKGPEKSVVETVKEAATRLINISAEEFRSAESREKYYFERVREIIQSSPELGVAASKIDFYARMVVREMIGYGVIDALTHDDQLEEIMVLGPTKPVYVFHREYGMLKTNIMFGDDEEIKNIIDRIARDVGRRVDNQSPMLDARLPDGSRVNATIKPISIEGATLTIRKFREEPFSITDLINCGTIDTTFAAFLWTSVDGLGAKPANILISGGTGSGKTTTLNVCASLIPDRERIISIEDTAELNLPIKHWIRFETRPPGIEGTGEISMDVLVKNSLRMRPDRLIVGEIRHVEAFTLFTAMNTGHDGCLGTVHANSAEETTARLMNPPMSVPGVMLKGLDYIIIQNRIHDKKRGTIRRVVEVSEITGVEGDRVGLQTIFQWDPTTDSVKSTSMPSVYLQKLQRYTGMSRANIDEEIKRRKAFLDSLVKKKITKMNDVKKEVDKFLAGSV